MIFQQFSPRHDRFYLYPNTTTVDTASVFGTIRKHMQNFRLICMLQLRHAQETNALFYTRGQICQPLSTPREITELSHKN